MASQEDWNSRKRHHQLPNGQRLAWLELGDPAAEPLMLVHGFTDTSRSWSLAAPYLQDFRLLIPDLRGHGDSAIPSRGYALTTMAEDLIEFLDFHSLPSTHLAGHSLGGMLAQIIAAKAPSRLRGMILVGTGTSLSFDPHGWPWRDIEAASFPIDPDGPFMRAWFENARPVDSVFLAHERREAAAIPKHVWRQLLLEITLARPGQLNPIFSGPAAILWGSADPLFSAEDQATLRASLPGAAFVPIAGGGHNLPWESPGEVAQHIIATIRGRG